VNAESSRRKLDEIGSRPENVSPFGAYDMVGNVWEWTSSNLTAYPNGAIPPPPPGAYKVIRGGSWQSNQQQATTTYRYGWPAQGGKDYNNTGFRCVRSIDRQANNR
jgi:iron(II)-dependent oxidoreductase